MTVLRSTDRRRLDGGDPHRARVTRRDDPEPSLDELLDDPVLQVLMARDGVERPTLERLLDRTRRRLGLPAWAGLSARALGEATLWAECR